jgi:NSS family neurotransmitter:Na+ symporter
MNKDRGSFSRVGFILAAAGSAVGLGNLWRFPYTVGENGGGLFVLIYLISVIVIAVPVLIAEVTLGRFTRKNPVGAFDTIRPGSPWKIVGYVGVATGFMILSYYAVIAGWTVYYFVNAVAGKFSGMTSGSATDSFHEFTANPYLQILLFAFFVFLTVYVVSRGVSGGIERFSKILMPVLLGILVLLLIRALTLEGASRGVEFYLKPDMKALRPGLIIAAMGQAFFSLSLGMGTMITYGSYVDKKENLPTSAGWIAFFDTFIAVLAGFIIFPAIFSQGMDPAVGSGVMFITLPVLFAKMPGGIIFGSLFFLLLSIAALTSTISILEVPVAYFIDEKNLSRKKTAYVVGFIAFLIGIPSALSNGCSAFFTKLPLIKMGFQDLWNHIWGNYSLSFGAFFIAIFVSYVWKTSSALQEIAQGTGRFRIAILWVIAIKFIAPVVILLILLSSIF